MEEIHHRKFVAPMFHCLFLVAPKAFCSVTEQNSMVRERRREKENGGKKLSVRGGGRGVRGKGERDGERWNCFQFTKK